MAVGDVTLVALSSTPTVEIEGVNLRMANNGRLRFKNAAGSTGAEIFVFTDDVFVLDNEGTAGTKLRANNDDTRAIWLGGDGRVALGAVSVTTSTLLELLSTVGALMLPRMTTAQRDALTATNGMLIYNTTTGTVQARAGGAWASL